MADQYRFHDHSIEQLAALAARLGATMSDPSAGDGGAAAPAAGDGGAPPPAPAPGGGDDGLAALPESWQKEIRDLRSESASRRTAHKPFEDAFGGLDDNDRSAVLDFVKTYKTDPAAAGAMAKSWAEALTPAQRGAAAEAAGAAPDDQPMTRAEFAAAMAAHDAERDQARGTQLAVSQMQTEARGLGIDPDGPEYLLLIQAMDRLGTTDMAAGKAEVDKFFQAKVDAYRDAKAREAAEGKTVPGGGGPAAAKHEIKSIADADRAAREYLNSLKG